MGKTFQVSDLTGVGMALQRSALIKNFLRPVLTQRLIKVGKAGFRAVVVRSIAGGRLKCG